MKLFISGEKSMQEDKKRELIPISSQAHQHLKAVVAAMKSNGLPTSGTLIASEVILSIPIPQPQPKSKTIVEKKRQIRKPAKRVRMSAAAEMAL
jgi:hypothetical protein